MKKHVIAPCGICLLLMILSGLYIHRKYTMQVENQKELMVWYVSDVKTKLQVIKSRVRELPHIVKPIIDETNLMDVNVDSKYTENIELLEQFYIENNFYIRELSVFNKNGDVFNLYRNKTGEFIKDIYKSRAINTLHSDMMVVAENNSFSIVAPVFHGNSLIGNVKVSFDIISMQEELYKSYIEKRNLWPTSVLNQEALITLPLDDEWVLSHEKDIVRLIQEQRSGFLHGKITGTILSAQVVTYVERLPIPEYYLGVAFSSNISPFKTSSLIAFLVVFLVLTAIAITSSLILNRMIVANRETVNLKDKTINVLQVIYDNSPVAFFVNRNEVFFTANNYFFKLFEGFASLDDTRKLNLPFKVNQEYKEWTLCSFSKIGKEISLGRRQMSLELDGDKYSIDAFWDITEMEQRLKEAVRSKITKSELLSRVSSEVRKTLNNVNDAVTLLTQKSPDEEYIAHINHLTAGLSGLLGDVQDYADIESGRVVLDEMPFNLVDEIKKVTELYQNETQQKGVELRVHIAASAIRNVVGDPQRFQQVVNELMSNAVKFIDKGSIRISLETTELQGRKILVKCYVDDTGRGMPREELKKLFALDLRVKNEGDSIGLGVIIIRKLVNMMGGKLSVASPSPISTDPSIPGMRFSFSIVCHSDQPIDKGLDFSSIQSFQEIKVLTITSDIHQTQYIDNFLKRRGIHSDFFIYNKETADLLINKLIIDKSRYQMVVIAMENSKISFDIANDIYLNRLAGYCIFVMVDSHAHRGNYLKAKSLDMDYYFLASSDMSIYDSILKNHFPNLSYSDIAITELIRSNLQIMIADNNVLGQMVARLIFKKIGYEVDIVSDASELENQIEQKTYDIIFIDLMFPPVNGFEVSKMLRKRKYKMPIIAMTATLTKENLKHISSSGINGYLPKPLNPDSIRQILVKWFC